MTNINKLPREVLDTALKEAIHIPPNELLEPPSLRLRGEQGPIVRSAACEVAQFLEDFPRLYMAIRTLRLEGSFDLDLLKLVSKMLHVENLYISLDILQGDDVSGLVAALPLSRPRRLVLGGCPDVRSIAKIQVMRIIHRAIGFDT